MALLTEDDQNKMDAENDAEPASQRAGDAMTDGAEPPAATEDVTMAQTGSAEPLCQHTAAKAEAVKKEADLPADNPNHKDFLEKDDSSDSTEYATAEPPGAKKTRDSPGTPAKPPMLNLASKAKAAPSMASFGRKAGESSGGAKRPRIDALWEIA